MLISRGNATLRTITRFSLWNRIVRQLFLFALATIAFLPFISLLYSIFWSEEPYPLELYHHLIQTVLPHYLFNSMVLAGLTGTFSMIWGISAAWLLTRYEFLFSRIFSYVLVLPFAVPSYIIAYTYTDFFDYSGPVQSFLRHFLGFKSAKDYFFPEIRSITGCAFVLSLNLYPYIYMLTRSSFLEQSEELSQTAKLFGLTWFQRFRMISLPLSRPTIVIGLCVVFMETLGNFVTVEYFSIPTISLGIYNVWFHMNDIHSAIRIAFLSIFIVFFIMAIEGYFRRKQKQYTLTSHSSPLKPKPLRGVSAFFSIAFLGIIVFLGFIFPLIFLIYHALPTFISQLQISWLKIIGNSIFLAFLVEIFIFSLIIGLLSGLYLNTQKKRLKTSQSLFSFGYAMPGTILALGILFFSSSIFNKIPDYFLSINLFSIKSYFSVVYAHVIRFGFIPLALITTSMRNISPEIDQSIKLYGINKAQLIKKVHFPLLRRAFFTGALIVFIESIKEVPSTLILRPFNFETISTTLYSFISDEAIEKAAFPSLIILCICLIPVGILSWQINKSSADNSKKNSFEFHQKVEKQSNH